MFLSKEIEYICYKYYHYFMFKDVLVDYNSKLLLYDNMYIAWDWNKNWLFRIDLK